MKHIFGILLLILFIGCEPDTETEFIDATPTDLLTNLGPWELIELSTINGPFPTTKGTLIFSGVNYELNGSENLWGGSFISGRWQWKDFDQFSNVLIFENFNEIGIDTEAEVLTLSKVELAFKYVFNGETLVLRFLHNRN